LLSDTEVGIEQAGHSFSLNARTFINCWLINKSNNIKWNQRQIFHKTHFHISL
jgi:hypothetical protein